MVMVMESQISVHFTEFSTIFKQITSHEYSDEQKFEMMEFLKAQTKERHLDLINKLAVDSGDKLDKIGETAIAVIEKNKEAIYDCKDLFLSLLDGAISSAVMSEWSPGRSGDPCRSVSNTAYLDGELDNYRRKNEKLLLEIEMLRTELEEKISLLDSLEIKNQNLTGLKAQFERVLEKCNLLETENDSLKNQINLDQNLLEEARESEEKLKKEIGSLKDTISMKRYIIKSFENEKEIMITDFQLLSEEVVERDLIIQSLNENHEETEAEDGRENFAFLLDSASEIALSDAPDMTSTLTSSSARLLLAKQSCENCARQAAPTFSSLLPSLRKSNQHFDDSSASLSSTAADLQLLLSKPKSLGDELNEIKAVRIEKGKIQLIELLGKMYLLEIELKAAREKFEKTSKKLLDPQNTHKMMRFRVVKGKLTKMIFTKYTGVKIN